jgi:hypothetical protein
VTGAGEPERRWAGGVPSPRYVPYILAAATLSSGVLLVSLTARMTYRYDDWYVLLAGRDWSPHALLDPQYEHIVFARNVIFKALLAIFGIGSEVPFSIVSTSVFLLSAVLLFVYMRRRVGDWLALIATTVILFLGAAWEDLLWPIQIVHFGVIACGLGMLLALEREDRTGDRLACALLTLSISFFTLGFVFAAGAAVDIVQRREVWRQRIYILVVPCFLYFLWWLGWGHTGGNSLSWHDIGSIPIFVLDSIAAGIASLFGLAGSTTVPTVQTSLDWGRPLVPVVFLLAIWRLQRFERVPRFFWIVATIGFSSWIIGALGQQIGRLPDASRYQYPSAIFILLMAAELLRGVRLSRTGLIAAAVVAAAAVMGNLTQLIDIYKVRKGESEQEKAALAAIEIARDRVAPVFKLPTPDTHFEQFVSLTFPYTKFTPGPPIDYFSVNARGYLNVVDDFGSPAFTQDELADSPEAAREVADRVLAAALGIKPVGSEAPSSAAAGPTPMLIGPPGALAGRNTHCLKLNATAEPPLIELPSGGATLSSGPGSGFEVRLRRFASTALPVDLGNLPPDSSAVVDIPTDRSSQPWKLSLDGSGPVDVCGRS